MENWLHSLEGLARGQSGILLGDWNAHCEEWDTESREDGKGKALKKWMGGNGFELVQPDGATWCRFQEDEISTSTIDLVWTKETEWQPKASEGLMSDHRVILGEIIMEREAAKAREREVVDWGGILGFAEDLKEKEKEEEERIYEITEGEIAYDKLAYLQKCFVKLQRISSRSKKWWGSKLGEQLKVVRKEGRGGKGQGAKAHDPAKWMR